MAPGDKKEDNLFIKQVSEKEKRKLKTMRDNKGSVWAGLGMFGMVGWSVAVPALLGAALGIWLDKTYRQSFSWTLSCLVVGLFTGCVVAWYWIQKEDKEMHKTKDQKDE